MKFHKYDEFLASSAQPSTDQLRDLKEDGWEVIVNISPMTARNALREEAAIVEELGLDYVHFPVDCTRLRPLHYLTFRGIMKGFEGKRVLVHCGGNIKSSNLVYMYQVLELGQGEAEALADLRKIQEPEPKWFAYFEAMGIKKGGRAA